MSPAPDGPARTTMNLPSNPPATVAEAVDESLPLPAAHNREDAVPRHFGAFGALVQTNCAGAPHVDAEELLGIVAMLRDADWACDPAVHASLSTLLAQAGCAGFSAADASPRLPWPVLLREIHAYRDFLRLRGIESALRRLPAEQFHFDRRDWLDARDAEGILRGHQREVRETSYAPTPADLFRVH